MEWISVRNRWPDKPGEYLVKDCRHDDMQGQTHYDGYDFHKWEPKQRPKKGSLLFIEYTTTHWMPLPEPPKE